MKSLILACFAFAATLPALAADTPEKAVKALQGVWKPVAASLAGQPLPPDLLAAITLEIEGDAYRVTVNGQVDKGTTKIDTAVTPHRMAISGVEGPNKGKTYPAIYEIVDADTFRVCYDLSGKDYPAELKSSDGTQLYLVTYKRQAKQGK